MSEGHYTSLFTGRSVPTDSFFTQEPRAQFVPRSDVAAEIIEAMQQQGAERANDDPALDAYIKAAASPPAYRGDLPMATCPWASSFRAIAKISPMTTST